MPQRISPASSPPTAVGLYRKETRGFSRGVASDRCGCAVCSKVAAAAGSQGLCFPARSGPSFEATSAVFRATGKKFLWATRLLLF